MPKQMAQLVVVMMMLAPAVLHGQSVRITSPSDGQRVVVGQMLSVVVEVTGMNPRGIMLVGTLPKGGSAGRVSEPWVFNIPIPQTLAAGEYTIGAVAGDGQREGITSSLIRVDVESAVSGTRLIVEPGNVLLPYAGSQMPLTIEVQADAGRYGVTKSKDTQVTTLPNDVVSVGTGGIVTALRPGSGQILVSYHGLQSQVPVTIGGGMRGDLNNDGVVDQDDLNILMMFMNSPAVVANDARDLNGDRKIDALDARVLTTLCTRARCATR